MTDVLAIAADSSVTDEHVISRVLLGEKDAYEIIIRRYNSRLYKIARTYVRDEDDIEDILQETYVKAYLKLSKFEGRAKLGTWLIRILINEALACVNKQSRKSTLADDLLVEKIEREQSIEQKIIQNNVKDILEKAIDNLSPKLGAVFVMREVENLSIRETSEALSISEENVKVRLYRAKMTLKEMISKNMEGVDLFSFLGERCNRFSENLMIRIRQIDFSKRV